MASVSVYELMREAYPFRGVWRWLILPVVLTAGGVLEGLIGSAVAGNFGFLWPFYAVLLGTHAFAVGAALALGRRPMVGVLWGIGLGVAAGLVAERLLTMVMGAPVSSDRSWQAHAARGVAGGLAVLAHRVYLALRRRWSRGLWVAGPATYAAGALGAIGAWALAFGMSAGEWAASSGVSALINWSAMALAAGAAERAAPAPAPPAPPES